MKTSKIEYGKVEMIELLLKYHVLNSKKLKRVGIKEEDKIYSELDFKKYLYCCYLSIGNGYERYSVGDFIQVAYILDCEIDKAIKKISKNSINDSLIYNQNELTRELIIKFLGPNIQETLDELKSTTEYGKYLDKILKINSSKIEDGFALIKKKFFRQTHIISYNRH